MAKKKVKKAAKKKVVKKDIVITTSSDTQILKLTNEVKAQAKDIYNLNQRIDNLILAISKSKKVIGI